MRSIAHATLRVIVTEYSVLPWSGGSMQDRYGEFTGGEEVSPIVRLGAGEVLMVISTHVVRMILTLSPAFGLAILCSYALIRGSVRVIP